MTRFSRVAPGLLIFAAACAAPAYADVGVNKSFSPISASVTQISTLTIDLLNSASTAATGVSITDALPAGLVIATPPSASTTCGGGAIAAPAGGTSVALSGGTIPAAGAGPGLCTVSVNVVANSPASYVNTIPVGAVSSSQGSNTQSAQATFTVVALAPVAGSKAFSPANVHGGGVTTLTITLPNSNGIALTNVSFADTLPAQLVIASPTNLSTTCAVGTPTGASGGGVVGLSGATIPANASCTVTVNVTPAAPNTFFSANATNSVAAGNLTSSQNVTNSAFSNTVMVQTSAQVSKGFAPNPIFTGANSTLTIRIYNYNNSAMAPINLTDNLPAGITAVGPAATTCAGGTASFTAASVSVAGGSLAAAPIGVGSTSCTLTVVVTAVNAGINPIILTNTIPAGSFGGENYTAASATLTVNPPSNISGSKAFSGNLVQTGVMTMTVTLTNRTAIAATITSFLDDLATMGAGFTIAPYPPAAVPSTTCAGGVVNASIGATQIMMSTGVIPANGSCTITVPVAIAATATVATHTNTIAVGNIVTTVGSNAVTLTGSAAITAALTLTKTFNPATVFAGTATQLTITVKRNANVVALTNIALSDTLPAGHLIATPPLAATTCGGLVTAVAGGNVVSLGGGSLAGGAAATSCTVQVNVVTPSGSAGAATNTIPVGNVTTAQGVSNVSAAAATITRVTNFVSLGKGFSPATVAVNGTSQLSLQILNNNPGATALANVGLTDNLPTGMLIASPANATFTGGGCSGATLTAVPGASVVGLSGASIAANAVCLIQLNVIATSAGNLINQIPGGSVTSTQGTSNLSPVSATLASTGQADLNITKTDGVTTAVAGTSVTYTIVAGNTGPDPVAGANVIDNPPGSETFVSWTCVPSAGAACGTASGSGPISALVSIPVNGSATFTVVAAIAPNAVGTAVNTAMIVAPGSVVDFNQGNNSATDTDTLFSQADLSITKTDGSATYTPGTSVTYTIVAGNSGPSSVTGALVTDALPPAIAGVTWTVAYTGGASGPASGSGNINALVNLPVSATATFTVTGIVSTSAIGNLVNTATITVPAGTTDPNPANNSATDTDTIATIADLGITKTDGSATYTPGSAITYTIVASNAGPSAVTGATLSDALPPTISGTTWTASYTGGASGPANGAGNIAALVGFPVGGTATFTVTGSVSASASGNLVNTATITVPAGTTDPNPANNSATDTDTASPSADISATKTGPASISYGGALTYSVVVTNNGPSNADGTNFSDPVPAGVTGVAASCGAPTGGAACGAVNVAGNTVTSTITTLPTGASVTFTINGNAPTTGASITNSASAAVPSGTTDPVPGNNTGSVTTNLLPPQLSVTKSASPNPFVVGQPATYTIAVQNTGAGATSGAITIADNLPTGITLTGASGANWICAGISALSCTFSGTLAPNASATLTLNVGVAASATNANNTATASGGSDASCPGAAHCIGSVSVPVAASADIAVTKSVDNAIPDVGQTVTFTITTTNNGPSDATGVQITDALPSGLAFVSATPSQGAYDSASGLWAVGALANGTNATLQITATVLMPGLLTNTATRTGGDQLDPDPSNNAGSASLNAQPSADLQVAKTVSNATPNLGTDVTYTIMLTNAGPNDASGVAVTDQLPAGVNFVSAVASQGTYDAVTGVWTIGAVPNANAVTLAITATVSLPGNIMNTAAVSASDQFDPNPSNNSAGATVNGQSADLQVVKTVDNANPVRGATVTFTVTATNNGPSNATGVAITDGLPPGLAFVSATPSQGVYANATGIWTVGSLAATGPAATATLSIVATVNTDAGFTNTAAVSAADQPDPNPANNSSSVVVNPVASADIAVVKTGPAAAVAGQPVVYTLAVTNNGPSDAASVSLDDPTPAGLTFVSATAACTGGFPCGLGTLANGAMTTITVTFAVPSDATGPIANTATVGSATSDPTPGNNTSTVSTPVDAVADLAAVKTGPATVAASGAIAYSVVVTNNGPSDANGASFSDPVPAAITGVTASCGTPTGGAVCGAINLAGNDVTSAITMLPAGASVSFTISGAAPADAATLTNTATIAPPTGVTDPDNSNNNSSVATTVNAQADLAVVKSGPAIAVPGTTVTYSIAVTNNGPSTATSVSLADPTPAGLVFVSASAPCAGGFACALGDLAAGANVNITVVYAVPSGAMGSIVNTATVSSPTGDPDAGNNSSTVTTPVAASADLAAVKTGPATVTAGGAIGYSVVVTNHGPSDANGAAFSDPVPALITGVAATCGTPTVGAVCGAVSVAGNNVTSLITSLPNGGSVTFTISGTAPANATALTNTATIAPAPGTTDPNNANNNSSANTTVNASADVSIVKTGPATIASDATISYTLLIANAGPSAADGATWSDIVPAGITGVTASCASPSGGAACAAPTVAGNTVSGAVATFPANSSITITISGTTPFGAQTLNNTAIVTPPPGVPDPNAGNNSSSVSTTIGAAADIALTKTVDNPVPNVGDTVTFTITATNNGPDDATGVALTDSLPFGLGFVSATPSQGSYTSATGLWTIGALADGASVTLTIVANIDQPGGLTNTVAVSASDQPDPNTSNNNAGASVNAGASADIGVAKTVDNAAPNVGGTVTYTLTATNHGPNDATGIEITDQLPSGVSFVSAIPAAAYNAGSGVWTVGALANGVAATLAITVNVTAPGSITNTATISHEDQFDPVGANNSAGVTINGQQADLAVTKTVDNATPNVGSNVTFTVTVHNNGPSDATNVALTDNLPAGLAFVSATPSRGSYASATGLWTVGTLTASGATSTATLTMVATVTQAGAQTNTASVSASDQPDPNTTNNSGSASLNGNPQADLALVKSGPATVTPGNNVVYMIVVTNNGPSAATNVAIADPTPAGLTFVGNSGACTSAYPCSLATLANGVSATITSTYSVPANYAGANPIVNTASVTSDTPDPDTTNNQGSSETQVGPGNADLAIVKTGPATAASGGAISYALTITNNGPSPANGASYNDVVPAAISGVTSTCGGETGGAACASQPVVTGNTVAGTIGTLPSGGAAVITISGTAPQGPVALSNTATVAPPTGVNDPNPVNNSSSVTTNVGAPSADLSVDKTGPAQLVAGANATYTLSVTNHGPDTALAVQLADPAPAGLTFVSASTPCQGGFPCALADLPNGASTIVSVTFAVAANVSGSIANTAIVSSPTADPNPVNNTSTVTVPVTITPTSADLAVTKTGPASAIPGSNIAYTIVVTNAGPDAAANVVVNDPTPAGLTFVGNSGACATSYPCALGTLANGAGATITSTYAVPSNYAGPNPIVNTATVGSDTPDPNGANNIGTATTPVIVAVVLADLSVTKSGPATATAGSSVTYTLVVANHGPDAVPDAVLADPTPVGLGFVSASAPCAGGFPCALGALANGASVTLTVTYAIDAGFSGSIVNTASANSATVPDPVPNNNAGSATTIVSGVNPGTPITPVPIDAGWMLVLMTLLLTLASAPLVRRRR